MDRTMRPIIINLNQRIAEEEGTIDTHLKDQILRALGVYAAMSIKQKNKTSFQDNNLLLQGVIKKIHTLPIHNKEVQYTNKSLKEMKKYLLGLEKVIKKAKPGEHAGVMARSVNYAKKVDKILQEKDRNQIALNLLKLFMSVPPTKISKPVDQTSMKLHEAYSVIDTFDIRGVSRTHIPNLKAKLLDVISVAEAIQQISKQILNKLEEKLGGNPDKVLEKLYHEIVKHEKHMLELAPPVSESTLKSAIEKLYVLNNRVDKVSAKNNLQKDRKEELKRKITVVSKDLKDINQNYSILKNFEIKMTQIAETKGDFIKKKTCWDSELKQVKTIDSNNKVIKEKRDHLISRIKGFILVEGMSYVRHKLEVIEDHKSYAQQFAYPSQIKMYDIKMKEIQSVLEGLEFSHDDNSVFKARVKVVENRVREAARLLQEKANKNDETTSTLEELARLQLEVLDINKNPQLTIDTFNQIRHRINQIDDLSFRVLKKKREILQQLHRNEIDVYNKHFPKIAPDVKHHLHTYESLTEQHNISRKSENYNASQAIKAARSSMSAVIRSKVELEDVEGFQQIFRKLFDQMEELVQRRNEFYNAVAEMNTIENELKQLSRSTVPHSEKTKVLNALTLLNLQKNLKTEQAKIEISGSLNFKIQELLSKLKNAAPHSDATMRILEEILLLKESIEDLPNGNDELNSQKKSALQRLYSLFITLDRPLAEIAFTKRRFENVLNVENYFTKFEFAGISNKESVNFVRQICSFAKTFENNIRYYFGSKESVDYYIIHEHLSRCSDELDQLKCDDDILLDETVKAMNYIKQLKLELKNNAYCSD